MSKVQFYFDKRQLPQIIGLGLLSTGMMAYFTVKLITPPPLERAAAANRMVAASRAKALPSSESIELALLTNGMAPADSMHDPFVPLLSQQPTVPASAVKTTVRPAGFTRPSVHSDFADSLPLSADIKPLAPLSPTGQTAALNAPAASWTVTGVLAGPGSHNDIAVLRNGDSRRFVQLGDMVDDQYRLIGIDRYGVTLASGTTHIRINLGVSKTAPAASASAATPSTPPTASTISSIVPQAAAIN